MFRRLSRAIARFTKTPEERIEEARLRLELARIDAERIALTGDTDKWWKSLLSSASQTGAVLFVILIFLLYGAFPHVYNSFNRSIHGENAPQITATESRDFQQPAANNLPYLVGMLTSGGVGYVLGKAKAKGRTDRARSQSDEA